LLREKLICDMVPCLDGDVEGLVPSLTLPNEPNDALEFDLCNPFDTTVFDPCKVLVVAVCSNEPSLK
jgi:hypothetical protein